MRKVKITLMQSERFQTLCKQIRQRLNSGPVQLDAEQQHQSSKIFHGAQVTVWLEKKVALSS